MKKISANIGELEAISCRVRFSTDIWSITRLAFPTGQCNEGDGNDHDFYERLSIKEDKDGVDDNGDDDDGNVWSIFRLVQATQGKLHGNGGKRATK